MRKWQGISLAMPEDMIKALTKKAKRQDRSRSAIVRRLLKEYLDGENDRDICSDSD